MSVNLNPMGITGPTSPAWKEQPDYRVPSAPGVTVQPIQPGAVRGNPLGITGPLSAHVEPDTPLGASISAHVMPKGVVPPALAQGY